MTFYNISQIKFIIEHQKRDFFFLQNFSHLADQELFKFYPIGKIHQNLITIDEHIDVMILEKILNKNYF